MNPDQRMGQNYLMSFFCKSGMSIVGSNQNILGKSLRCICSTQGENFTGNKQREVEIEDAII